jgi:uncharacterized membrane protein YbhN (UPF0104 family)
VRIYYAARDNPGRRTEVATVLLLDRAMGMLALMLWPLLAVAFVPELLGSGSAIPGLLLVAAALSAVMIVGMLLSFSTRLRHSALAERAFGTLPLGRYVERMVDTVQAYRDHKRALAGAVAVSLLAHCLAVGSALLVAHAVVPNGVTGSMCVLIPLGFLANSIPVTPGGLGVGEAAFGKLFALAGLSGGAETLFGWRLLMIAIGMIGLVVYLRGCERFVHAPAGSEPSPVGIPVGAEAAFSQT